MMDMKQFIPPESMGRIMRSSQRQTHVYIIGQPGVGKSRLIESWFMQDVLAGNGVGIIDPHGDLFNNLLARVAMYPEVWKKVVIINPCDTKWSVSINPLGANGDESKGRMAWFLTDVILNIWSTKMSEAPRMSWLMGNTFSALAELKLPLTCLPRFLLDADFRGERLQKIINHETRRYFELEFPRTANGVRQWAAPLLNKMGEFLYDPDIRCMLSETSGLDFRDLMDRSNILLVNIPKGILGENASALLGAFIVAQLQKSALARTNTSVRKPFYLYLDEFQNYTTDNISDILSESRKYALSLIIANQYLNQLSSGIREAVLNTSGSLISFRIGYEDAVKLARHIFPSPDFLGYKKVGLDLKGSGLLPHLRFHEEDVNEGWEVCAQALASLPKRHFWLRSRGTQKPARFKSLDMLDPPTNHEMQTRISALVDTSGIRYARLKGGIQKGDVHDIFSQTEHPSGSDQDSESLPLWQV